MLFTPDECLSQLFYGIFSALGAVGLAFAPQVLRVLRCLISAALQKRLCSWASEKGDDCLIQLDRKENNKKCRANIASKRLVVEETEKWKQRGGEILHMYRMKKLCLRWAWAWQVTPECRSHRPAAELICSGFGTQYDTCMSLFSARSEKSWLKVGAILLELEQ